MAKSTLIDRFLAKVEWSDQRHDGTRCLVWTACLNRGYGQFSVEGRKRASAHRWLYERWVGPIPAGLQLDHLCRNPPCCNPAHLEPVTNAENVRRGIAGNEKLAVTHCPQGHPYDEENTYRNPRGHRFCRTCARIRDRIRPPRRRRSTPASPSREETPVTPTKERT